LILFWLGVKHFRSEFGFFIGRGVVEIADAARISAAVFKTTERLDGGVELVLEAGEIAAEEVDAVARVGGGFPCGGEYSDIVDVVEGVESGCEMDGHFNVEEGGLHEGESFEAPLDVGDLADEAEFDFRGGAEVVDPGFEVFVVAVFGLMVEDGVDAGSEAVFEGGAGGAELAGIGDGAFRSGSVDAGLFGAGELRFGRFRSGFGRSGGLG
jgi:hypothetical protein